MTVGIFLFILALAAILLFTFKPIKFNKNKDEKCDGCSEDSCDTCPLLNDFKNFKEDFYSETSFDNKEKDDE